MASTRAKQLEKLAMSLPQENQRTAQAQQQARQVQLQSQIQQASPTAGPALAQQMGAQQAAQAGQIQSQAAQRGQQQTQLMGQTALSEMGRQQRQEGFEQQLALSANQRSAADRLANIDKKLKTQLLDDQLQFRKDQAGQDLLNERQLADWAALKAESGEEFAEYAQAAQQVYEREIQMLETANKKITQALEQGYIAKNKPLDREMRKKLAQQKQALELEIQKKQNKAANKSAIFSTAGALGGAAVGGLIAGPAGAMAGSAVGQGLGTVLGGVIK